MVEQEKGRVSKTTQALRKDLLVFYHNSHTNRVNAGMLLITAICRVLVTLAEERNTESTNWGSACSTKRTKRRCAKFDA